MSTGFVLNIPQEMINRLEDADKKIEKLAKTSEDAQVRIVSAFKSINAHGIDAFINKLTEAQTKLANLGNTKVDFGANASIFSNLALNAQKAIDEVNNVVAAIGKIKTASGENGRMQNPFLGSGISESLAKLNSEIEQAKRNFSELQNQFTHLSVPAGDKSNLTNIQNEAQFLMEYIRVLEKEKNGLIAAKNALAEANKTLQQKDPFKAKVDDLSRDSLEAQRYKDSMQAMKEFYAEQDKERKKAAKKAEEDRKKREKEEKETAERIATYDSKARKERYKAYTSTYEGAVRTSDRAKTLLQEQQAIKNLEAARAKLNKTSSDYANKLRNLNQRILEHKNNIDKATAGSKNLQKQHRSLMDISGQLARRLALVFSVSQITGYVKKLIEVRGEFELQQRSLQAILQNKDEANRIWQQTVDLAVRSPFRVKELVSYTKQLAAYRIESDKLFETNKMLADISAGLGVDMQRLILALGQVRSAAYLRGTELRQFTEAGIPILEQLADYFTELEGRAVSVGDVFERVSKRMVSFADVEEIFKRMTSEGGAFYRMQEIQAETLQGQISNLRDSVDIMLNDIGKANETTLKNSVALVRGVVENWEKIAAVAVPVLGSLITRWGLFKASTMQSSGALSGFFKTFGMHFGVVITQLTRGTRVAKAFAKATEVSIMGGWATVILTVVAAIGVLVRSIQNVTKVKRELEKIDLSGAFDASRSVAEYKRLAEVVADTSKSYDEQQKALSTLKTKYEDILPAHLLESNTIKALKGNYDEATNAIYDYIAAKTKEKQIEVIQTELGADVETQAGDLADDIRKALAKVAPNITRADVLPIVNKLRELIQVGDVNVLNVDETIKRLVKEFTGLEISADAWKYTFSAANGEMVTLENNAESLIDALGKMKQAMNEVTSSSLRWQDSFVYQDFNEVREGYEKQSEAIGKYYETIRRYEQEREDKGESGVSGELRRDYEAATNALNNIFTEANQKAPQWSAIINEPFKLNEATINANKILWQKMIADINAMPVLPSKAGAKQNYVELLGDELEAFAGTAKQQEVARVAQDLADTMRVSLEGLDELFLKSDESLSDYAKRISGTLEQYKTGVLQFDTDIKNGTKFGDYTKEQVSLMREQIPFLEEFLKLFEAFLTPKKGTTEDTFSPMLRTVKEIYQEFKKLQGSFDDLTAKEGALAKFGDAFKEAFGKTPEQMGFDLFSEEGVKAAYDYLISKAPDAKKKIQAQLAKGEIVWDVKLQKKKDTDKELLDDIQQLFDRYDLSVELKKLNIPPDLAKSLFDVDYLDLDGLKKAVEDQKEAFAGKDMLDEYDDLMKKIGELSRKRQEEDAKEFINFLKKNLNEIQVIQDKGAYNITLADRLFGEGKITAEQYMSSVRQIIEDTNKEVSKANLELFKDSPKYIQAMGDLTAYSAKEIRELIKSLEGVVAANSDAFSADEAKAYVDAIYNAQERLDELEKSPFRWETFADIGDILKTDKEINEQKAEKNRLQEQEKKQLEELVLLEEKLKKLQEEKNAILSGEGDLDSKAKKLAPIQSDIDATTQAIKDGQQAVAATQSQAKTTETILGKLGDKIKSLTGKGGGAASTIAIIDAIINGINDTVQGVLDITNEVGSVMESFGKDTDMSTDFGKFQKGFAIFAESSQHAADGWNALKSGDPVGAVVSVVKSVTSLIRGINEYKDAKFQVEIDKQAKEIERLGKAYEKLEKATEDAYSIEQLQRNNEQLERNIELQRASYKAMIAAEESKKNSDEEQIAAWNEELEALTQQWEGLKQSLLEGVGGVTDYRSQTRAFVDSWVSAFQETGNGLSGLKDNFRDFFDNIIAEQAALRVTEKFLAPFYESLNTALGDLELTVQESKSLRAEADKIMPELSKALELIWNELGGSRGDAEGGRISALQKGIQGITESTAQVLEAIANSSRGYLANIDSKFDSLLTSMGTGSEENPMLEQMRLVARNTVAINTLLNSLVKGGHPQGGAGLKVFMN